MKVRKWWGAKDLIMNKLDGTRGYQMQSECDGVHDGSPYKQVNPMQHYEPINKEVWDYLDGNGFHLMSTMYTETGE